MHRVMHWTPRQMFFDFHIADYSIPLGILNWLFAHTVGLSELAIRMPMMVAGIALLLVLPCYVFRKLGPTITSCFALLLAASPMLIIYSQMGRPYAITLLLGYVCHAAFQRYNEGSAIAGYFYVVCAALAIWLHPAIAPFVMAPFAWAIWRFRSENATTRRSALRRMLMLAGSTAVVAGTLVIPPLLAHPQSLGSKSGLDAPTLETLLGLGYWWLGTHSTMVLLLCLFLIAVGARSVLTAFPEAVTAIFGLGLTGAAVAMFQPQYVQHVPTLGRYLLPAIPLLLLLLAAGSAIAAKRAISWTKHSNSLTSVTALALVPAVLLFASSPLPNLLAQPNSYHLAATTYYDFRDEKNVIAQRLKSIPMSDFWNSLETLPPNSVTVAAAPFQFESFDWAAPIWERVSKQRVIPGLLTDLCVPLRGGEVPHNDDFRFKNAVHLVDRAALDKHAISYVVWQKPFLLESDRSKTIGADVAHCEAKLKERFGSPSYQDDRVTVFTLRPR